MPDDNLMMINVMGVPDYINNILNRSIKLCYDYDCGCINGASLLLSVISTIEDRDEKLKKCNTTYSLLKSSFEYLASTGDYGSIDTINPETVVNSYVIELIGKVVNSGNSDMCTEFLKVLKESQDTELKNYLQYTNLDLDRLIKLNVSTTFSIPSNLANFVTDTHKLVKDKEEKIENVDDYVDKMINILARKNRKNPCLVGESGVGKTSIVEALVKRLDSGNVPDCLKGKHVVSVNGAAMIGGTKFRGDFEQRMSTLFKFASNSNVILFLDEIHAFMSLGKNSDESAQSMGNNIKEYLSDGRISIIGTTTPKEWHKYIESDSGLTRRIQDVHVGEPSVDKCISMVKNTIANYNEYHGVEITDEAIETAVKLSDKYMKLEKLPDKAFKVIDQACATIKIDNKKLVDTDSILKVISELTNIDVNKLGKTEMEKLKNLEDAIHKSIIGQNEAVTKVVKAVRRGKLGISDSSKPVASFLFVGPTGVGKTELCKVLSKELYNSKESFIRIDMSEFSAEFSSSKLIGSAPGYVGYGEGGNLTEKVKKNPNSLILLDEIEKANPKVFDSFLQVLDDGRLTDAEGQTVDFTNCIIVMTSNAGYGADKLNKKVMGFNTDANGEEKSSAEREKIAVKELEGTFRPEFLNRIDSIVIFDKLSKAQCEDIAKLSLDKISTRLQDKNINVKFAKSVVDKIVEHGYSDKYGARNINREIQNTVEDFIADSMIEGNLNSGDAKQIYYKGDKLQLKETK